MHPLDDAIRTLKERREALGLSLEVVGAEIGFPAGRLGHYECGMRRPSLAGLVMWAKALNCRVIVDGSAVPIDGAPATADYQWLCTLAARGFTFRATT